MATEVPKVLACFCGHNHVDRHHVQEDIHYVQVNSASYHWVGEQYGRLAPYRDPLFAFVTITPTHIEIEGRQSVFVAPTPAERGFPRAAEVTASIEDRRLSLSAE